MSQAHAHYLVRNAVLAGDLVRPGTCERCGQGGRQIQGHHADYSKPLEVEWLCRSCHTKHHRQERKAKLPVVHYRTVMTRIPRSDADFLRRRAKRNDRSVSKELGRLIREVREIEDEREAA